LKCLTILQPWASLLMSGAKRFETRSWLTNHRGLLAIHAGQRFPPAARALCAIEPYRTVLREAGFRDSADLPRGVVLGYVELSGCFPTEDLVIHEIVPVGSMEWAFGDYRPGRWAWSCRWPTRLAAPFEFPGWRGLFDVPDHLFRRRTMPRFPLPSSDNHSPLTTHHEHSHP
jgi:hypothetical protein